MTVKNSSQSLPLGFHNTPHGADPAETGWEASAARKREDRTNRLKPYARWGLGELAPPPSHKNVTSFVHARLTERERLFLASDVTDLAQRLASQECTSLEVTTAFCKAAYAAQELTNCLTEVMFDLALARAKELDAHISTTGQVVGPLHGVPVSIKDHISIKGEDTNVGFVTWAGRNIAEEDATIVRILRQAGAVIYVKTTNPQGLFAFETSSNIYGYTTNPHNRTLTSGGSSGGEGALIASRASLLGVGTDLAGSIRGPAGWCGLYGLKPSSHRLPSSGLLVPYEGVEGLATVIGPMAHSARDLELFCRVVSHYEPWNTDFSTLCLPWNSAVTERKESEKLVIGFFTHDGVVAPHPPIIEHLHKARDALVAAGHEVIDWAPTGHMLALELTAKLNFPDRGETIRAILAESGEPAMPPIAQTLEELKHLGAEKFTLSQSWETNTQRDQFRAQMLKHWNDTALRSKSGRPVDAILCPVASTLAAPHGTTRWVGYTSYWNLLDLPAVVFPSKKAFDASAWESGSNSSSSRDKPLNPIDEYVRAQWDPKAFDGAPISLQLVGRRWQEEKLLAALQHVEDAMARFDQP